MAIGSPTSIGATVLGYPRIGRKRELEKALEALWSGAIDGAEFDQVAASVRRDAVATMAGFDARRYFAMARGTDAIAPLEMTKWFDTNYHYLVPEIGPRTEFVANAGKPLQEFAEASADHLSAPRTGQHHRGPLTAESIRTGISWTGVTQPSDEQPKLLDTHMPVLASRSAPVQEQRDSACVGAGRQP